MLTAAETLEDGGVCSCTKHPSDICSITLEITHIIWNSQKMKYNMFRSFLDYLQSSTTAPAEHIRNIKGEIRYHLNAIATLRCPPQWRHCNVERHYAGISNKNIP